MAGKVHGEQPEPPAPGKVRHPPPGRGRRARPRPGLARTLCSRCRRQISSLWIRLSPQTGFSPAICPISNVSRASFGGRPPPLGQVHCRRKEPPVPAQQRLRGHQPAHPQGSREQPGQAASTIRSAESTSWGPAAAAPPPSGPAPAVRHPSTPPNPPAAPPIRSGGRRSAKAPVWSRPAILPAQRPSRKAYSQVRHLCPVLGPNRVGGGEVPAHPACSRTWRTFSPETLSLALGRIKPRNKYPHHPVAHRVRGGHGLNRGGGRCVRGCVPARPASRRAAALPLPGPQGPRRQLPTYPGILQACLPRRTRSDKPAARCVRHRPGHTRRIAPVQRQKPGHHWLDISRSVVTNRTNSP